MEKEISLEIGYSNHFSHSHLRNNNEQINHFETEFYLNRNFDYCLKEINTQFDKIRTKDSNNRHKCLRNPLCNCIYYGKFLIEIFSNNQEEYAKQFENYYYCCPIYIPYELFINIIFRMLNQMEFSTARVWIEAYLTYTNKEDFKSINTYGKNNNKLSLSNRELLEISELLIFKIVLVKEGFKIAEAKVKSLKIDNEIIDKILEKLSLIEGEYIKKPDNKNKSLENRLKKIEDREKKLNDFIDNKINSEYGINTTKYTDFNVKGSFSQLLYRILLNKKTIIMMIILFFIIIINRFFKGHITNIQVSLGKISYIRKSLDFLKTLLSLLVNS